MNTESPSSPVYELPPDAPLEEAAAPVAGEDAVVLAARRVPAHDARQARGDPLQRPTPLVVQAGRRGRVEAVHGHRGAAGVLLQGRRAPARRGVHADRGRAPAPEGAAARG